MERMPPVSTGKDHLHPTRYIAWSYIRHRRAHLRKLRLKDLSYSRGTLILGLFIINRLRKFHSPYLNTLLPTYLLNNADLLNIFGHLR